MFIIQDTFTHLSALLVLLPYLISSMHGYGLFKIGTK